MPLLKATNKQNPNREVATRFIRPPDGNPRTNPQDYLPDAEISILYNPREGVSFSTTNKLVLTLERQPLHDLTTELEPPSVFWSGMATRGTGIWGSSLWFKDLTPSPTGFQRDQYTSVQAGPVNVTINGNVAIIEITEAFVNGVKNSFQRRGITLPSEGLLRLIYDRHFINRDGDDARNRVKEFLWVRTTFNPIIRVLPAAPRTVEIAAPPPRIQKADFTTSPTAYENLHVPALSGCFVYNFFEVNEESLEASRQRNYSLKRLTEIPRYVELNWNPSPATLVSRPPLTASYVSTPRPPRSFRRPQSISSRFLPRANQPTLRVRNAALFAAGILNRSGSFFRPTTQQNIAGQTARRSAEIRYPSFQSPRSPFFSLFGGGSIGGSRTQPERNARRGRTLRLGGRTFSIGGQFEEESNIFGSRTKTARLASGLFDRSGIQPSLYQPGGLFSAFAQENDRIRLNPTSFGRLSISPRRARRRSRPGPPVAIDAEPQFVDEDSTTNLGLSEEEDEILDELVRDVDQPDAVAGPNEFSRYIGYVLMKERFNPATDRFEPVDLMAILDRRKTRITDTKVAYGDTYRYKIRSVYKFVNVDKLPLFRDQDSILSQSVVATFDGGQPFRNAFYFDSKFSEPIEVSCTEQKRPDPPYSIRLFPNSKKKEIMITWNQKQPERDIVGYNIYRKRPISGSTFSRLNTNILRTRDNFFVDNQVDFDTDYVYSIDTVDTHNNTSKLSRQFSARIRSQDFTVGRVESGVKLEVDEELEVGERPADEIKDITKFRRNLHLVVNPLFGNLDREVTYLLRVKSLDTFEEKDIKLNFQTKIITHRRILPSDEQLDERRNEIDSDFEDVERERFGLTRTEILRRRDRRTRGRDGFEE